MTELALFCGLCDEQITDWLKTSDTGVIVQPCGHEQPDSGFVEREVPAP